MGGINQIGKEEVMFHFCVRWVHRRLSLTLTLDAKILKSSMDTV